MATEAERLSNVIALSGARVKDFGPMDIIGTTGLRQYGGFIDEEFLARLKGPRGVQYYRQMVDNNSTLGSVFFVINGLVRQVPSKVEAASDKPEAKRWQEWLDGAMQDMSYTFIDTVCEVLSMLPYGWAWFEKVYKLRKGDTNDPRTRSQFNDGMWGLRKCEVRGQETLYRWEIDQVDRGIRGMWQLDPYAGRGTRFIPIEKSVLFRTTTTKNNPEGRSLLRSAVRSYHYLTRIEEIEAIGIERDLAGMPMFEVPMELLMPTANAGQQHLRRLLETMVQQIRVDERFGALVPSSTNADGKPTGFKFGLTSTGGRRQIDTNEIIKRYESRIAMVFLCDFLFVGHEKVGTQSLFRGKNNLFGISMGTFLDLIYTTWNKYVVEPLMRLNGVPRELWPKVTHSELASPELEKMGDFVQKLSVAGVLSPNRLLEDRLLQMADLPTPDDDDGAVFDDPTVPTPADPEDQATGILSDRQVAAVINVNTAVSSGKMSLKAGTRLIARVLGVDEATAADYVEPDAITKPEQTGPDANEPPQPEGPPQ